MHKTNIITLCTVSLSSSSSLYSGLGGGGKPGGGPGGIKPGGRPGICRILFSSDACRGGW